MVKQICQTKLEAENVRRKVPTRPRFEYELPRIRLDTAKCPFCQPKKSDGEEDDSGVVDFEEESIQYYHEPWDEVVNASKVILSDPGTIDNLETSNVILLDEYTNNVQTGEQVTLTGSIQRMTVKGRTSSYIFVGLNPIKNVDNPFKYVNKKESVDLKEDDIKEINEFLKNKSLKHSLA
jgi:DNA replicative helicase MCM subunit Mcm2 (Cdc46/Mcm family)